MYKMHPTKLAWLYYGPDNPIKAVFRDFSRGSSRLNLSETQYNLCAKQCLFRSLSNSKQMT